MPTLTNATFIAVFAGSQLVLGGLDLLDRYLPAHEERPRGAARPAALAFLGGVMVVYLVLQVGLSKLAPRHDEVVARVTAALGGAESVTGGGGASGWAIALAVLVGLYAGRLADYLVHRFVSHSRALFFTHEYHHLPSEVFLLMPGLAARPFAVVASFPVTVVIAVTAYGTLALLGQPLGDATPLQALVLAQVLLLVSNHSSFLRRFRGLHRAMTCLGLTTAREHLLHHTTDLRGNFANLTTVWDRVFGTYLDPDRPEHAGHRLGLAHDQDWLGAVTAGWVKLPQRVRERFDIGRWCNLGS